MIDSNKKLVLLSHPRSCGTYFMSQFGFSPHLKLVEDMGHFELLPPNYRHKTREFLNLNDIPNKESGNWDYDDRYIDEYFRKNPNGAFKMIISDHKISSICRLQEVHGSMLVSIQRQDEASTLASIINKLNIKSTRPTIGSKVWASPSREDGGLLKYSDWCSSPSIMYDKRRRELTRIYYAIIVKSKMMMEMIDTPYSFYTEDLGADFTCSQLEDELEMEFDFSDYIQPSHYSEIFPDWEYYRDDIRDVLGNIPGL